MYKRQYHCSSSKLEYFIRYVYWVDWVRKVSIYKQRNLFEILLNQPEIRLYLPFSDWFGTERNSVWLKIHRERVNTI